MSYKEVYAYIVLIKRVRPQWFIISASEFASVAIYCIICSKL